MKQAINQNTRIEISPIKFIYLSYVINEFNSCVYFAEYVKTGKETEPVNTMSLIFSLSDNTWWNIKQMLDKLYGKNQNIRTWINQMKKLENKGEQK